MDLAASTEESGPRKIGGIWVESEVEFGQKPIPKLIQVSNNVTLAHSNSF